MKKFKKVLCIILTAVLIIGIAPIQTHAKQKPKLNAKKVTIEMEGSACLYVIAYTKKVKWSSTNKKVATVDKYGMVTPISEGTCKIKAKCGKTTLSCIVTVIYKDEKKVSDLWFYADHLQTRIFTLYYYQEYAGTEDYDDDTTPSLELKMLEKDAAKIAEMDKLCDSIKSEEYDLFKEVWKMFYAEFNIQYEHAKNTNYEIIPVTTHNIQYERLSDYSNKMCQLIPE